MFASIPSRDDGRRNGKSNERFTYPSTLLTHHPYLPLVCAFNSPVWGMASTLISFILSLIFEKVFRFPQWAKLGVCFPNALSLPLLLLNSLQETHVIEGLLWGPDDTVADAVRRGRTYILVLIPPFSG
jgi:hypothetical protein